MRLDAPLSPEESGASCCSAVLSAQRAEQPLTCADCVQTKRRFANSLPNNFPVMGYPKSITEMMWM
ncbi:hypothetical protein EES44_24500 [Streptomyces sp. ADI96-15]|nr:hypothetical protein EES44_24500 [Streptomyces sp. ADI96-15]